ncbi:MAG: sensor histidine kinase, partial [Terracidiphilus sp.]
MQDSAWEPEAIREDDLSLLDDRQMKAASQRSGFRHADADSSGGVFGDHQRWKYFATLAYSVFFWIEPLVHPALRTWIYFICAYTVFVGLYSVLILEPRPQMRRAALLGMAVLGFVYAPFNSGFLGIYIYVAAFLPFSVERFRNVVVFLLATCGSMFALGYFLHMNAWTWSTLTFVALAAGGGNIVHAQEHRAARALGIANEKIERLAKLAERERIARDLHDVLGHTLSVIVLKSELAGKVFQQDAGRARREIGEVEHIARTALGEVRQAIRGYRSEGLAAEIDR